jgi:hypothetical protein
MSFQAYIDNIKAKTGKSPDDFRALAAAKGFTDLHGLAKGVTATQILDWLAADFDLGRGHGMAIVAILKGAKPG